MQHLRGRKSFNFDLRVMTLEEYTLANTSCPVEDALRWIERQTHLRTNHARMLSGKTQGMLLRMLAMSIGARNILEIGAFTGYCTVCLASSGAHVDTLEIDDEREDILREGFRRSGFEDNITLHIGDALETMEKLTTKYDLIFIDANKRHYPAYYEKSLELLADGGLIVADNILWDGKIVDPNANDAQSEALKSFNEIVTNDPRVENVILPLRDGLNIIRKKQYDQGR